MKSSIRDRAESTFHQVKGKVKEVAGKLSGNGTLEVEGDIETMEGKVQENTGKIKKVLNK